MVVNQRLLVVNLLVIIKSLVGNEIIDLCILLPCGVWDKFLQRMVGVDKSFI